MAFETLTLRDFRGGLDLVSSKPNVRPRFSPNAWNFTINQDGGLDKVLGWDPIGAPTVFPALKKLATFRYGSNERIIAVSDTSIRSVDSAGVSTLVQSGRASSPDTTFATFEELPGGTALTSGEQLFILDDANDMRAWDGTTLSAAFVPGVNTGPKHGKILGVWESTMYTAVAGESLRIEWSAPGVVTGTNSWPVENNVRLDTLGLGTEIVGAHNVPGGLLVLTDEACFKIYGQSGEFTLLSNDGCTSSDSIVMVEGIVYWVNQNGIMATDGNSIPINVSRLVEPVFRLDPDLSNAAGFGFRGKYSASLSRFGGVNDITLEFDPRNSVDGSSGSIMASELPGLSFAVAEFSANRDVYFIDHNDPTKIMRAFSTGTTGADTDISCYYETAPLDLGAQDTLKRINRARVVGRGDMLMSVKPDYLEDEFDGVGLGLPSIEGDVWDTLIWDAGSWAGWTVSEAFRRLTRRGRTFSFRFAETSGLVAEQRSALGFPGEDIGSASIIIIEPQFVFNVRRNR